MLLVVAVVQLELVIQMEQEELEQQVQLMEHLLQEQVVEVVVVVMELLKQEVTVEVVQHQQEV